MKKLAGVLIFLLGMCSANAAVVTLIGNPASWRIENYIGGNQVTVWYSGSSCATGQLTLPSTASLLDHSRLYATIVAAKNANTRVFILYDNVDSRCPIISFGVPEQ